MRIGIITSNASFLNNYGAALQAYALSKQLSIWGHHVEIINYKYNTGTEITSVEHKVDRSIKSTFSYILKSDTTLKQKVLHRLARNRRSLMEQKFKDFIIDYLPINLEIEATYDDLKEDSKYDCLITGSDQVWNPYIHADKNDPACFLDFGNRKAIRVAYAPSFGVSELPESCKKTLPYYINKLDAVSIRERSGAKIIKEVCGKEVPIVLDPTMMADNCIWSSFNDRPVDIPEKYILVYRFGKMNYTDKYIKAFQKLTKLPVIELPISIESYGKGTTLYYKAGPAEFIALIKNAEYILTDSFHASVFSILNHKKFYTFLRQEKGMKNNMNTRMENLLDSLQLNNRLIYPDNRLHISLKNIDFSRTDEIICEQREKSQKFLKESISGRSL